MRCTKVDFPAPAIPIVMMSVGFRALESFSAMVDVDALMDYT